MVGADSKVSLCSQALSAGMPHLTVKSLERKEKGKRRVSTNCFIYNFKIISDIYTVYNYLIF